MIDVSEISQRLNNRVEAVCQMLLPGGRVVKDQWICGDLNGGEGKSLKVTLAGNHAGNWRDWGASGDDYGDLLDLWRLTRNLSPGEAVKQAKEFLDIRDPISTASNRTYAPAPKKALSAPPETGGAHAWLRNVRKLTSATIDAFKLKIQRGPESHPDVLVFESHSPKGEVVNRSYRAIPKDPSGEKKVWQDKDCAPSLFGWQAITKEVLRSKTILICEGQIDAMTWHQWGIPALSVSNGSGMTWVDYEWDNLQFFEKIYLALDNDVTGKSILEKVIARLGADRCHIVSFSAKDANDALQAGRDAGDAAMWLRDAQVPRVPGLITAADLLDRLTEEMRPKPKPFTMDFFSIDWRNQYGFFFRPGEVTLWTGHSHAGKSTFLNFVMNAFLATSGEDGIFIGSFEVKPETTLRRMITAALGQGSDPIDPVGVSDYIGVYGHRLVFADVVGFVEEGPLFEMMRFAFRRYGVTWFVIDSLMKIKGIDEDYTKQGDLINRLQEFAKSTGVHINLVAHPRKGQGGTSKPGLLDIKGSSLIANGVDNIIAVCRNNEKAEAAKEGELTDEQKDEYDAEIRIEKQKESGWLGAFHLNFDPRTFTYTPAKKPSKFIPTAKPQNKGSSNWNKRFD